MIISDKLINSYYQSILQVKSIKFTEWNKGANPEMSPVTVHIHVNRNNLGFEVCKMCILMMCTFLYFSFFVCLLCKVHFIIYKS